MNLLSEYFKGISNKYAIGRAAIIVDAQHQNSKDIPKLARRYNLEIDIVRKYRHFREGNTDKSKLPKSLKNGVYQNLIQDSLRARVMSPEEIQELIEIANPKGLYPKNTKEKQPEIQPLDFESEDRDWTREEVKKLVETCKAEELAIVPNYNTTPPTEEQQRSNGMSVFFGFMLGIVAMLLFILVERGTL